MGNCKLFVHPSFYLGQFWWSVLRWEWSSVEDNDKDVMICSENKCLWKTSSQGCWLYRTLVRTAKKGTFSKTESITYHTTVCLTAQKYSKWIERLTEVKLSYWDIFIVPVYTWLVEGLIRWENVPLLLWIVWCAKCTLYQCSSTTSMCNGQTSIFFHTFLFALSYFGQHGQVLDTPDTGQRKHVGQLTVWETLMRFFKGHAP